MPELPEVETTRRGISQLLLGSSVSRVIVRQPKLRWPVPAELAIELPGQTINKVERRAKYLLLATEAGTVLIHLGMSGSLRIVTTNDPPGKHDHLDIITGDSQLCLRYNDPRRFGTVLWVTTDVASHKLLKSLGPEPLSDSFSGSYLFQKAKPRRLTVKQFIMDAKVVVGVGNIYASEALFMAGISPLALANNISKTSYIRLCQAIKSVLNKAILAGGTTLKNFVATDGRPGYFSQQLLVYGREGMPCLNSNCKGSIQKITIAQRSSYFCKNCQPSKLAKELA